MSKPPTRKLRCAIYTRKSSEEGLEQEFNSLDAQRDACTAYIASQRSEGWVALADRYDDGGVSGGTLDRPALKRLLDDIEGGLVDVVVVYKIDRLSRALMDFANLVEVFDRNNVTFVSVTQSFNTTTSMGRLTLNILLSFAQFEREVIGERIRDKIAASRKRGMWMGGVVPLGYQVRDRKLVIDEKEAAIVRMIFDRFLELGSAALLAKSIAADGIQGRRGKPLNKGSLYKLLANRTYIGEVTHKGAVYPGQHQPIISRQVWDKVRCHTAGKSADQSRSNSGRNAGIAEGPDLRADRHSHEPHSHSSRQQAVSLLRQSGGLEAWARMPARYAECPAAEIEAAVVDQLRGMLRSPEVIVATWRAARSEIDGLSENAVREALERLDPLWDELFPAEQARIVQLLVERVDVGVDGLEIHLAGPKALRTPSVNWPASLGAASGGMSDPKVASDDVVRFSVPFAIRKRGGRKLVLVPGGTDTVPDRPRVDNAMVKALARAFRWRKLLEAGAYGTIEELAEAEKINPSYVSRILRLTLLAPDIVELVLNGIHDPSLYWRP